MFAGINPREPENEGEKLISALTGEEYKNSNFSFSIC